MTRVAIVTGSGRRLGRAIARRLFDDGFNVFLHCNRSVKEVESLCEELNQIRKGSAVYYSADFHWGSRSSSTMGAHPADPCCTNTREGTLQPANTLRVRCERLVDACLRSFGRCDVLVNNASAFFPTPLISTKPEGNTCPRCNRPIDVDTNAKDHNGATLGCGCTDEDEEAAACLLGSNALAPYYLTKAFANAMKESVESAPASLEETLPGPSGSSGLPSRAIVNIIDSMLDRPIPGFTLYTMGKQALLGLTTSAAIELAPCGIRVNAVAPGLSLLPEEMSEAAQQALRATVPLGQKEASAEIIADAVVYLVGSPYITGVSLPVDGGWRLSRCTDPQQVDKKW